MPPCRPKKSETRRARRQEHCKGEKSRPSKCKVGPAKADRLVMESYTPLHPFHVYFDTQVTLLHYGHVLIHDGRLISSF